MSAFVGVYLIQLYQFTEMNQTQFVCPATYNPTLHAHLTLAAALLSILD